MKLSDFDYKLPEVLIASYPAKRRTGSRLLFLNAADKSHRDLRFIELESLLRAGDLLVFNNSRVFPARLFAQRKTGGRVELLIERILDDTTILAHIRSSKSLRIGELIQLTDSFLLPPAANPTNTDNHACSPIDPLNIEVIDREGELFKLRCYFTQPILDVLDKVGWIPLPPYIKRMADSNDRERYQTVYAEKVGSIAAPTAGLHFDQPFIERLQNKGVKTAFLTLHVGAGTFQPLRTDVIENHRLHSECFELTPAVCEQINSTKEQGKRVIAVGTTTVRALETACLSGKLEPFSGETNLFIYPGFRFQCVDAMLTNFHLPKSSLLMLVAAFGGTQAVMSAYNHAVAEHYRFYSYGDAMFVVR